MQVTLQGTPGSGVLSYDQVVDWVKEAATKLANFQSALDGVYTRVSHVETTLDPVLSRADAEIQNLKTQSEEIKDVVGRELKTQ